MHRNKITSQLIKNGKSCALFARDDVCVTVSVTVGAFVNVCVSVTV